MVTPHGPLRPLWGHGMATGHGCQPSSISFRSRCLPAASGQVGQTGWTRDSASTSHVPAIAHQISSLDPTLSFQLKNYS